MPVSLPAVTQAAAVSNDETELHIDYYDLFMCMVQIIFIMVILCAVIWICIQVWICINTRNLGILDKKLNFMQFLYADKAGLYFQFMSNYMTWSVYLSSVYDNPEGIEVIGQFMNGDVTLFKGCVFDFFTMQ